MSLFMILLFLLMWGGMTYTYLTTGCIGPRPGAPAVCGNPGALAFGIISIFFVVSIFFLVRGEIKKKREPKS